MHALLSDGTLVLGSRSTGLSKMVQEPRAGFHVAKWRAFCHTARLQISPARFKQVYPDSALWSSGSRALHLAHWAFRVGVVKSLGWFLLVLR